MFQGGKKSNGISPSFNPLKSSPRKQKVLPPNPATEQTARSLVCRGTGGWSANGTFSPPKVIQGREYRVKVFSFWTLDARMIQDAALWWTTAP